MYRFLLAALALIVFAMPLWAADKAAGKASGSKPAAAAPAEGDEDKSTTPVESDFKWSVFPSGGEPVTAFTPAGNFLWYATATKVEMVSMAAKPKKSDMATYEKLGSLPANIVTCMTVDQTGSVVIGTSEGLAIRKGAEFVNYTTGNGLPDNAVKAVAAGRNGRIWVGTGNGAAEFDGSAWKAYTTQNGLPGNVVDALLIDDLGRVWVGTDKGIGCLESGTWTVHNMKKGMSWNNTRALGYDIRKKVLWAAVGDNDVNAFDGKTWKVYMSIKPGITSIIADTQSRVWFGSEAGLTKFNGEEWISEPDKIGISAAQVSCMLREPNGNMWFGTDQGVIKLLNPYPY